VCFSHLHQFYFVIILGLHISHLILHFMCELSTSIEYHVVRDRVPSKTPVVKFLSSKDQIADIFTKYLVTYRFH
jgi:uncharacterized protein YpmS